MRLFFCFLPAIIFSLDCFAQNRADFAGVFSRISQHELTQGVRKIKEGEIAGSPYLDKEFKNGLIIKTDGSEVSDILLRYNVYSNTMQFKQNGTILDIANPTTISRIIIEDQIFIYAPYVASKKIRLSYFQLLTEGKYQLLKKYNSVYQSAEPRTEKAARFENLHPDYFLRYKDGMARQVFSKKELIRILQPVSNEIIDYLQRKRIDVDNEPELISTMLYINNAVK